MQDFSKFIHIVIEPWLKSSDSKELAAWPVASELPHLARKSIAEDFAMSEFASSTVVDEHRAAALLGLPLPELRWFSRMLGLGRKREAGNCSQVVFTYEELKRLSCEAAASDE